MFWVLGPQIIGITLLLIGIIQKYFPPKAINTWYGYRTPAAMRNQQTWDEANRYSAGLMIKMGLVALVSGLTVTFGLSLLQLSKTTLSVIQFVLITAPGIGLAVSLIVYTEKHLQKMFGGF